MKALAKAGRMPRGLPHERKGDRWIGSISNTNFGSKKCTYRLFWPRGGPVISSCDWNSRGDPFSVLWDGVGGGLTTLFLLSVFLLAARRSRGVSLRCN